MVHPQAMFAKTGSHYLTLNSLGEGRECEGRCVGVHRLSQRRRRCSGAAIPSSWTTLRVVTTNSGDLRVYVDSILVYSTSSLLLASATGAGPYRDSAGMGLVNRWDNFTVFNAP